MLTLIPDRHRLHQPAHPQPAAAARLHPVVVTHDLKSAFMVSDRFALVDRGRIRFSATTDEVRGTRDELMRELLNAAF